MPKETPMKGGDEYDGLTEWKGVLLWKPGQRKWIKNKFRRRVRQQWRKLLRKGEER